MTLPNCSSGKSWLRTFGGRPLGCHSWPALAKSPTSSFFFASTATAGWPARWQARTRMAAAFGREFRGRVVLGVLEFVQASSDRGAGQSGSLGHQGYTATFEGEGFASSPMAAEPFIQQRTQQGKLAPHSFQHGGSAHTINNGQMRCHPSNLLLPSS